MYQLVAVYGSLRKGMGNHRLLEGSEFVGKGSVKGFGMYSLGGFPALIKQGNTNDAVVEVYNVNPDTMNRLDRLEGFPSFYNRQYVSVDLGDKKVDAWIYYMEGHLQGRKFVEGGDWVEYYSNT